MAPIILYNRPCRPKNDKPKTKIINKKLKLYLYEKKI